MPKSRPTALIIFIALTFAQAGFIYGYHKATENYLKTTPVPPMVLDDLEAEYQKQYDEGK